MSLVQCHTANSATELGFASIAWPLSTHFLVESSIVLCFPNPQSVPVFLGLPSLGPHFCNDPSGVLLYFPSLHTRLFLPFHSSVLVCLVPTLQIPFPARSGKFCRLKHLFHNTPKSLLHPRPGSHLPLSLPANSNLKTETYTDQLFSSGIQA